jgi:hypothetical protein
MPAEARRSRSTIVLAVAGGLQVSAVLSASVPSRIFLTDTHGGPTVWATWWPVRRAVPAGPLPDPLQS